MRGTQQDRPTKLEQLPNIGKAVAADLRSIGIREPNQLAEQDPLEMYTALAEVTGHRHDPCVLYTFMAAKHFMERGEAVPWWKFTVEGKRILAAAKQPK